MALPSSSFVSFLVGLLILAYLSTFVIFAVVRTLWGVSIQRLWWSGLRHIAYTPREGLRIDVRGLRLSLHRPTFAQPTWISVVVTELKVSIDLKSLKKSKRGRTSAWDQWRGRSSSDKADAPSSPSDTDQEGAADDKDNEELSSQTWERLTRIKNWIKRLHTHIQWIRLVDFVATSTTVAVEEVGTFQVASFTINVDTRSKTVDRGRLFHHRATPEGRRKPAEWILTARGLLFSPDGFDFTELLDHATLNVHGMLSSRLEGLRDASISLKLGRLILPYDQLMACADRMAHVRRAKPSVVVGEEPSTPSTPLAAGSGIGAGAGTGTLEAASSRRKLTDSREFVKSILRGIHEVQFAVGDVDLSKRVEVAERKGGAPIYLNLSMKEVGMDLLRLDPKGPAHLTYFSRTDVAHQALVTAISISISLDDGHEHPERLLYVPLATATLKTTLPAKLVQSAARDKNVAQRNSNILYANVVVTSPSIDLDPKHLPATLTLVDTFLERRSAATARRSRHHTHALSRLLPKATIKLSIHEPVARVSLPCADGSHGFDLLISTLSSISIDVESSHSATGDFHYSLSCNYRVSSHHLYYQTAMGEKHNLVVTESVDIKVQVSASPDVAVVASGNFHSFSVSMIRPEISNGVRQIVEQLQRRRKSASESTRPSFLRRMPLWLHHVQLQGSDINFELAGIDKSVSNRTRGAALHMESCTAEYRVDRSDDLSSRQVRRRASSRSHQGDDLFIRTASRPSSRKSHSSSTDGRRLAVHTYGVEAFVIESADTWEPEPFLSLPRFETAFSTLTDQQGPLLHINSFARNIYLHYSLYRHYALGVAATVLQNTFYYSPRGPPDSPISATASLHARSKSEEFRMVASKTETVTVDFRSSMVQIKASMPAEPDLMLQMFNIEAGRHRWSAPFAKSSLVRLYAETPNVKKTWSRVVSMKNLRVDYRHLRRMSTSGYSEERSIDLVADAIRFGVPHQLIVHKIFDNLTNIVKTVEQLTHRFRTDSGEYLFEKKPQGPRRVPKVSLRTQYFLFEIEDGGFEWKLGLIYLQGLQEQKQRLAREEAFRLKLKKIEEVDAKMGPRRETTESKEKRLWHRRGRNKHKSLEDVTEKLRSKSLGEDDVDPGERPTSSPRLRYNSDGTCGLSDEARRTIDEAETVLHRFNARSWKRRIDSASRFQQDRMHEIHKTFWGEDELPDDAESRERIMRVPLRPALMSVMIRNLAIAVDKPSFPLHEYPQFLHRIGKGMPMDMKYSLLVPMNLSVTMGEARITLRDYPLPLFHVPPLRPGQSPRLSSLAFKTDVVIAEEFQDYRSIRLAKVTVVPPDGEDSKGLIVEVRRTVGAVKTYSDIAVEINTASPTRITWGASYQPAIQDAMQVVENFLKPAVDPSERVGFWDKIRLSFHSRVGVAWKSDGDVHLVFKGSRDPYLVTGSGAGFVMCWRNNVKWGIWQTGDPKEFMTVHSGEYVLAVPDLTQYARQPVTQTITNASRSYDPGGRFQKTVMKLSGRVRWLVGLVFERNTVKGGRSFNFAPHYEVVLKSPKYAESPGGLPYDAFRGFRSNHIHLSIAIAAPVDRDWTVTNLRPSSNYNSFHLTPLFFSHFFSWWSMFSGNLSLPIRQGPIWPGVDKTSKKFGRHLATIKYNLLLSPLYLSHIYKHKDPDEQGQNCIFATGLKVKLDSFMLDLHQRREELRKLVHGNKQSRTTAMRINKAQVDFISADFRAVSATMEEVTVEDIDATADEDLSEFYRPLPLADLSAFTIPDNDTGWVDMDDFVELDWVLPAKSSLETQILPLAFAPRFTYFRQTDHHNVISGDPNRSSPFGNEHTHYCVMSARNDPRRVQCDLLQERLDRVAEQISRNSRNIGDLELSIVREVAGRDELRTRLESLQSHQESLEQKRQFLDDMHKDIIRRLEDNDARVPHDPDGGAEDEFFEAREEYDHGDSDGTGADKGASNDDISDFNNRFIVHNVQLKWSNSLRNIILRYIHQVSQRRGFVYYMSRPAVKFILDIVEEQGKTKDSSTSRRSSAYDTGPGSPLSPLTMTADNKEVEKRIRQLLDDANRFVSADESDESAKSRKGAGRSGPDDVISREFTPQNAYHVRLIAPQIQLQSEKNTKSAVLVTAKHMQLKVVQIMDKDRVTDDVSGLVQRRFSAAMDNIQIFVTSSNSFSSELLDMYSANRYGTRARSSWPPWVPLEVMFDFKVDPYGFSRVVERTSASMRYDKFNTLRLKYNDDVTTGQGNRAQDGDASESRMDHIWVDFPQLLTKCDSTQYYALYVIVLDLLLWSEPLEKTRNERLEKIMLASDFSDLSPAPEMVIKLQEKIRTLQDIKLMFQVHDQTLTKQQWKERIVLEDDLARREDELFFIMKAITTSQSRFDDRTQTEEASGLLRWEIVAKELVWHLVQGVNESLIELQLKEAHYNRTDNNDGSNDNTMEIGKIQGWNLLSNASYPQIIAPFEEESKRAKEDATKPMLRVHWYMLEAVAGIPVMERFEVNVFPLRIQLEHEVGIKVFEYIFPGVASGKSENSDISPFMVKHTLPSHDNDDDDESDHEGPKSQAKDGAANGNGSLVTDSLTGAGDLELRLQPTLTLPDQKAPKSPRKPKTPQGSHIDLLRLRHFAHSDGNELRKLTVKTKNQDGSTPNSKASSIRINSGLSDSLMKREKDMDLSKRFTLRRANSLGSSKTGKRSARGNNDVTEMMSRASKYMTLAYVNIASMVLCLSYKGKGQRNLVTDVHDLVFRMPTLEYRNKTWSNYDLVMQLQREVIKALLSHSGAIIGNLFSHHRPTKLQQSRLREMANSSIILGSNTSSKSRAGSESASTRGLSIIEDDEDDDRYNSPSTSRPSFASGRVSEISHEEGDESLSNSMHSLNAAGMANGGAAPASSPPSRPWTSSGASMRSLSRRLSSASTTTTSTPFATPPPDNRLGLGPERPSSLRRLTGSSKRLSRHATPDTADKDSKDSSRRRSKIPLPKFLHSLQSQSSPPSKSP